MPRPQADDSDPLLSFAIEPGASAPAASPLEPATQPVAPAVDPPPVSQPPPPGELLLSRVERLERALDDSQRQVSDLTSQVTTLVRAAGDIRKQASPRPVASAPPVRPRASRSASAIAGLLIGVSAAMLGWMYVSSDRDVTIAAPVTSAAPEALEAATRLDAVKPLEAAKAVAAPPLEVRTAPQAPKAPQARQAPQAREASRYVGTLPVDAAPGGEVFVNRQSAGQTPLRLANLRAGSHLIWIERDGYRRWTRVVQVNADRVSRVSAELEPLAAR